MSRKGRRCRGQAVPDAEEKTGTWRTGETGTGARGEVTLRTSDRSRNWKQKKKNEEREEEEESKEILQGGFPEGEVLNGINPPTARRGPGNGLISRRTGSETFRKQQKGCRELERRRVLRASRGLGRTKSEILPVLRETPHTCRDAAGDVLGQDPGGRPGPGGRGPHPDLRPACGARAQAGRGRVGGAGGGPTDAARQPRGTRGTRPALGSGCWPPLGTARLRAALITTETVETAGGRSRGSPQARVAGSFQMRPKCPAQMQPRGRPAAWGRGGAPRTPASEISMLPVRWVQSL